jgi:ActR/RegA family two-component response regulator
MTPAGESTDTILIVDDEDAVRNTFREWLEEAGFDCRLLTAADAESALVQANQHVIDLAILDWNLGASDNGLHLLEDLLVFNPDTVAILVTGFAHQATPLDAMRMGVRDYLDKNHDLNQDTFLRAVNRQLERIRPAKRERRIHQGLVAFREALGQVLPLVQTSSALHDPVPLPAAVRSLFRFLLRGTGAQDGVLLARSYDPARQPPELFRAYDTAGQQREDPLVPFARSLAGTVVSLQEVSAMDEPDQAARAGGLELHPFERGRRSLLAAPLSITPGLQVVVELFDKQGPAGQSIAFTEQDRQLVRAAADFGAELILQALAERQSQQVLFDAVAAALEAGDQVARSIATPPPSVRGTPRRDTPPPDVLQRLREGWPQPSPDAPLDGGDTVRLAEAIRVLALHYGSPAVHQCIRLVEGLRELLDQVTGVTSEG